MVRYYKPRRARFSRRFTRRKSYVRKPLYRSRAFNRARPKWFIRKQSKGAMNTFRFIVLTEQAVQVAAGVGQPIVANRNALLAWLGVSQLNAGAHGNGVMAAAQGVYQQLNVNTQGFGTYINREILYDMVQRQRPNAADQVYLKAVKITMHNALASDNQPMFCMQYYTRDNEQLIIDAGANRHRALDPTNYKLTEALGKLKVYVRIRKRPTGAPLPAFIPCPMIGGGMTAQQITDWNIPDLYLGSMSYCRMKIKVYYRIRKLRL